MIQLIHFHKCKSPCTFFSYRQQPPGGQFGAPQGQQGGGGGWGGGGGGGNNYPQGYQQQPDQSKYPRQHRYKKVRLKIKLLQLAKIIRSAKNVLEIIYFLFDLMSNPSFPIFRLLYINICPIHVKLPKACFIK